LLLDAWLFNNEYNVSIINLVKQAINKNKFTNRKNQITAFGIFKWGSIKDIEYLRKFYRETKQILWTPIGLLELLLLETNLTS
jgi:hypothetical protein